MIVNGNIWLRTCELRWVQGRFVFVLAISIFICWIRLHGENFQSAAIEKNRSWTMCSFIVRLVAVDEYVDEFN